MYIYIYMCVCICIYVYIHAEEGVPDGGVALAPLPERIRVSHVALHDLQIPSPDTLSGQIAFPVRCCFYGRDYFLVLVELRCVNKPREVRSTAVRGPNTESRTT